LDVSLPSAATPILEEREPINPADNDQNSDHPEDNPEPTSDRDDPDSEDEPNLAISLKLLTKKISAIPDNSKSHSAIKPCVPDTFDGLDPQKLENFSFQCSMYITTRLADFLDDNSCVTFGERGVVGRQWVAKKHPPVSCSSERGVVHVKRWVVVAITSPPHRLTEGCWLNEWWWP
jgi:hypothetical protein